MPKPENSQATVTLEPSRRRLILERLHDGFYSETGPAERVAAAVLTALHEPDKGPALPH